MLKKIHISILILFLILTACSPQPAVEPVIVATEAVPTSIQVTKPPEPTATGDTATEVEMVSTAVCSAPAEITPELTEGPYYKSGSPERASLLEDGMPGTVLVLSGQVLDESCNPVANAWLDFWQADSKGVYDNVGNTLRGHIYTDANGFYRLETVVPGEYPGRTEHIHVKVQAPGGVILTTQVFFPGVQANDGDGIYDARNLIGIDSSSAEKVIAHFNFIIQQS
jgi:protocatechuate 3,4-dioxygenase beta subunit